MFLRLINNQNYVTLYVYNHIIISRSTQLFLVGFNCVIYWGLLCICACMLLSLHMLIINMSSFLAIYYLIFTTFCAKIIFCIDLRYKISQCLFCSFVHFPLRSEPRKRLHSCTVTVAIVNEQLFTRINVAFSEET